MRGKPRLIVALLAAALAVLVAAGCGGDSNGGEESTGTAQPPAGKSEPPKDAGNGKGGTNGGAGERSGGSSSSKGKGASGDSGSSHHAAAAVPPLEVSGGGSAQFRTKGGDNSIQEYGEEDESELQEAAEAVHGFYVARSAGSWAKACGYLSKATASQFEELASRSPQLKGQGCPAMLHALTRPLPASVEREVTLVDAASLRREGERGFLIYRGGEHKVYAMPMVQEGGSWKVGSLAGTPIG